MMVQMEMDGMHEAGMARAPLGQWDRSSKQER